jgi:predicted enzyme related to lactoylglutathione lyase
VAGEAGRMERLPWLSFAQANRLAHDHPMAHNRWLKGETGMANSHGCFVWYELMTTDMETAKAFYASVLGLGARDASAPGSAYSLFAIENSPVAGLMDLPEDARRAGATPHWIGYVAVDDVDAAVERIKQHGGAVYVPPTDVPGVSRFSVVADPQGATFALVKGRKSGQAQSAKPGAPGRVGWRELLAADWEKAFAFYGELFGWRKADSHFGAMGAYQGFSAGGEPIGGMFTKPATLPLPFWLYYFNTDDIQAAAKRVEAGGGQILYGPTAVPGGPWVVHCADPQGALFALLDRRRRKAIVSFERVASRDPADAASRR